MAYEDLNLGQLRRLALTYNSGSDAQNRWGSNMNLWINEGLRRFYQGHDGVEDSVTFTTVSGQRAYPLPEGYLYVRMFLLNGLPIEYRELMDQDYYAQGNSRPGWYTPWGGKLYLGPLAPDTAYTCQMFFYRSPKAMINDNDVPEIPQQWRTSLAKYGAAMACIADRDLQTAQALLQEYIYEKQDFDNYKTIRTRDNFLSIGNRFMV